MKLSILICSLEERKKDLAALLRNLKSQCKGKETQVEILTDVDNGEKKVGQKRNDLLKRAQGDYVCFVDDDDAVPDYYVSQILIAIQEKPDVIGIRGQLFIDGALKGKFTHSLKYDKWIDKDPEFFRPPNHLNPVKRKLALAAAFPSDRDHYEDRDYSKRLRPMLKTEAMIEALMYSYLYCPEKSAALKVWRRPIRFLFKYPTRGRPEWFRSTLKQWQSHLSGKHEHKFVISMDVDDPTMNTQEMRDFLKAQPNLEFYYGKNRTKVEAVNADMHGRDFDILVLVSDDMIPVAPDFDDIIVANMKKAFPYLNGALSYPDGLRTDQLITLSIIGKVLYDAMGYIYWPEYKSYFCDTEFTEVVHAMRHCQEIPFVLVKHIWKEHGEDETYKRCDKDWQADYDLYRTRKTVGFPGAIKTDAA